MREVCAEDGIVTQTRRKAMTGRKGDSVNEKDRSDDEEREEERIH